MPCFDCVGIKPVNPILCAVLKRCKADESRSKFSQPGGVAGTYIEAIDHLLARAHWATTLLQI